MTPVAAALFPFPRTIDASPDPMLNPARVRLAEAITALDRARAEVELAAEPVRRLSDVVAEYDRLEAQVRELDDRNASAIGAWIASGREGPAPDDDTDAKSLTARMVSPTAQRGRVVALFGNRRPDGAASALRAPAPRSAAPAYPPNVEVLSAHRRDVGFRRQS